MQRSNSRRKRTNHFSRQILVVNLYLWSGNRILLLRRSPLHTYGQRTLWNCPGGSIEFGEDPIAAIRREVFEETGIRPEVRDLVSVWAETFVNGVQIIGCSFWGECKTRTVRINEESIDYKWVSELEAKNLKTFGNFMDGLRRAQILRRKAKSHHKKAEKPQ